jgi:broad specificity phosphatase PhoE
LAYDRPPGPPLSEIGRAEARLAGIYLAGRGVQRLYASPLERAQGTAHAIADEAGLPVITEPALAEHRQEETFDAVKERVRGLLAGLERDTASVVALVSHGSPIKAMLHILSREQIDLSRHIYPNGNPVPTAGIWHARRGAQGWSLDLVFKPVVATPAAHVPV